LGGGDKNKFCYFFDHYHEWSTQKHRLWTGFHSCVGWGGALKQGGEHAGNRGFVCLFPEPRVPSRTTEGEGGVPPAVGSLGHTSSAGGKRRRAHTSFLIRRKISGGICHFVDLTPRPTGTLPSYARDPGLMKVCDVSAAGERITRYRVIRLPCILRLAPLHNPTAALRPTPYTPYRYALIAHIRTPHTPHP